MKPGMQRSLLAAAAVVLTAAAGCGSGAGPAAGSGVSSGASTGAPSAAPTAPPAATAPSAAGVPALTGSPADLTQPSQAVAGSGQPPAQLVTQDVVVGAGPVATATSTVDVQYSGTLYADGTLFDSSWSRGEPATFPLDRVVPGFAQGIEGMQVGGRRVIVIPPDLGYGPDTRGPIPGGSTLVFVVDLVGVR